MILVPFSKQSLCTVHKLTLKMKRKNGQDMVVEGKKTGTYSFFARLLAVPVLTNVPVETS